MTRPATADDLSELIAMGRRFAAAADIDAIGGFDVDAMSRTFRSMMDADYMALLIDDRGGMLGGVVYPNPFNAQLLAQEMFWWVNEDQRGAGVGRDLLQSFEGWARSRDAIGVTMLALADLDDAVPRMYQAHGYRELETTHLKVF